MSILEKEMAIIDKQISVKQQELLSLTQIKQSKKDNIVVAEKETLKTNRDIDLLVSDILESQEGAKHKYLSTCNKALQQQILISTPSQSLSQQKE